jgi:hypothetical protein
MLRGTLAFLVLVACAVAGAELRSVLARRGVRAPGIEGVGFLAVGFLLGGRALGLFPDDLVAALRVVVLFGLAWIGLVFGLQAELRIIRRLAPWHRWLGGLTPLAIGLPVAVAGVLLGLSPALALGLGSVAMASSPSALENLARGRRPTDRGTVRMLKLVMAFAGIPAVVVFAVATALASPLAAEHGGGLAAHELVIFMVAIGIVVGYAVVVLIRGISDHMKLLTLAAGSMCFAAGATAVLGLNPLPAAAIAGAVVVNRCVFPHRMLRVAHSLERPILVALLVLVGASWSTAAFSAEVFAVMTVVRMAAALAAGAGLTRIARNRNEVRLTGHVGWGLVPQGELALGLMVAVVSFFPATEGVLEAVVAAVLISNLAGGWWMRRRLFAPSDEAAP